MLTRRAAVATNAHAVFLAKTSSGDIHKQNCKSARTFQKFEFAADMKARRDLNCAALFDVNTAFLYARDTLARWHICHFAARQLCDTHAGGGGGGRACFLLRESPRVTQVVVGA